MNGVSKYPELQGLRGSAYRNAWNKLHREKMLEVSRKYRKTEKGKLSRKKWNYRGRHTPSGKRRRASYNKRANDRSRKKASMSRELWGPVEDAMLFSGISHKNLVPLLGRSILAIQLRKHRLRKQDEKDCVI